ncbi:hypothetical protein HK105_206957 [Polyrhizophydium stewartii]|uniref:AAA+ ATPase domain-containing protein n=1 Tax=Polyrhizophydium stewartii TaxID=2732419 RepID=A0ABR4N1T2_9FUNG
MRLLARSSSSTAAVSADGAGQLPPDHDRSQPPTAPSVRRIVAQHWQSPPAPAAAVGGSPAADPLSYAPYFLSQSVVRTLKLLVQAHTSLEQGSKHLVLANPHPGATVLMERTVAAVAADVSANMLSLDYQTLLRLSASAAATQQAWDKDASLRRFEKPELLKLSSSFSPSQFDAASIEDDDGSDDIANNQELDEDEEGDEVDDMGNLPSRGIRGSPFGFGATTSRSSTAASDPATERQPLFVKVNFVQEAAKPVAVQESTPASGALPESGASTSASDAADASTKPIIRITNISLQREPHDEPSPRDGSVLGNQSALNPLPVPFKMQPDSTHYDVALSNQQIEAILFVLRAEIIARSATSPARRLVIYLRDTVDILEARGGHGKSVVLAIMDLVLSLRRDHKIPAVFVAGCSPSLANFANVDKEPLFYSELFEGSSGLMDLETENIHSSVWTDGKLFETPLDSASQDFEKVEITPPCPVTPPIDIASPTPAHPQPTGDLGAADPDKVGNANSSTSDISSATSSADASANASADTSGSADANPAASPSKDFPDAIDGHNRISMHVEALQDDMAVHLRRINWGNIEAECLRRGFDVSEYALIALADGIDLVRFQPYVEMPQNIVSLLGMLETALWPLMQIEKLVNLAIGCSIDEAERASAPSSASHPPTVTLSHLLEALNVLQKTEISRLSRESATSSGGSIEESSANTAGSSDAPAENARSGFSSMSASRASVSSEVNDSNESAMLQQLIRRKGHAINQYEKRIMSTVVSPSNIQVGFSDLVLPPATKLMLQTLVTLPMLRPEFFSKGILSRSAISGVLLFGPPGTGKTMLAKAVAKSSGARFMNVGLSDVLDKYVGEGEKNVRAIFTLARKIAPCVVFLDEADALFAARRNDSSSSSRREIMNEFMAEWDGLKSNNSGVIVLGATNRPFDLDDAILRRMPRRILIDLPNKDARASILRKLLQDEPLDSNVDIDALAERTELYSGSDLKNLCVSAALARVKESIVRDLLKGTDDQPVTSEAVREHLAQLDDWSAHLGAPKAAPAARRWSQPAAAPTVGRRHRSVHAASAPSSGESAPAREEPQIHVLEPLTAAHFEAAFAEVPPSLTDEMQTLVDLRKWDSMFGDGASRRNGKKSRGWGFDFAGGSRQIQAVAPPKPAA